MAGADLPTNSSDLALLVEGQDRGVEGFRLGLVNVHNPQEPIGVDLVHELAQPPIEGAHEPVGLVRSQLPGVEHRSGGVHHRLNELGGKLVIAQQAVEGCMARNARLDGLGFRSEEDVDRLQARNGGDRHGRRGLGRRLGIPGTG